MQDRAVHEGCSPQAFTHVLRLPLTTVVLSEESRIGEFRLKQVSNLLSADLSWQQTVAIQHLRL